MKKKLNYTAPETEAMDIRFEQNIMSDVQQVSYIESTSDWAED